MPVISVSQVSGHPGRLQSGREKLDIKSAVNSLWKRASVGAVDRDFENGESKYINFFCFLPCVWSSIVYIIEVTVDQKLINLEMGLS